MLQTQNRIETMKLMAAMGHFVVGVVMVDGRRGMQRDLGTIEMAAGVVVEIVELKH